MHKYRRRNTPAFTFFARVALFGGGLYNETSLELNEKEYYLAVGSIVTQKVTRDNAEGNEILVEQQQSRNSNTSGTGGNL
ncbi:hypothetical protein [Bacillus sp. SG-1]|uniref:hypothetical protein n=1 Tax=Bacillus sp. SG-1 TaxID=161544 RepID=UPI00015440C2|nr:hypothetical protein [Bacillus sp. SG-1]EDL65936.1 YubF [Bacillus sp. SG-1]